MILNTKDWILDKLGRVQNGFIVHKQTPNWSGKCTPRVIVIHDTESALDVKSPVNWLCSHDARAGAHFVIGRNGELYQLASVWQRVWHAGISHYRGQMNVNEFGIGIELVDPGRLVPFGKNGGRSYFGVTFDRTAYDIVSYAGDKVHDAGLYMAYTARQLETCFNLCVVLEKWLSLEDVTTHWEIAPGRKTDPNPLFPLGALKDVLIGGHDNQPGT